MLNRKIGMTIVAGSVLALAQSALAESPATTAVQQDAATRASMQGETGGFDGTSFYLSDGTKSNRLFFGGYAQFRYNMNFRDTTDPDGAGPAVEPEDFTHGFQMRRVRIEAGGSVGDPNLEFRIQGDFADTNDEGDFFLRDAWAKYHFGNGMYIRAGQFKVGMLREELVSDSAQLLAERSVTNGIFTWGRSQGIGLIGTAGDQFRYFIDVTDGPNADNTPFDSGAESDIGLTGRVEFLAMGKDFKPFDMFTSWSGTPETSGMVGGAIGFATGGDTGAAGTGVGGADGATADGDLLQVTIDTQWAGDGWNAFGAGIYRTIDTPAFDSDDVGLIAQGGYYFQENLEGFARIDTVIPEDQPGIGDDAFTSIGGGINYYLVPKSQASKFTAQLVYYVNNITDSAALVTATSNQNLLPTSEDGQFGVILQWQTKW